MSLLSWDEALAKREGRKLVFTNGVFDILHVGHVRLLAAARELGDLLFVGINSDDSARSLGKGPNRPVNTLSDRAELLMSIRTVDGVVAFDERTPGKLISVLKPDVHVKGGDYQVDDLPEAPIVQSYGGKIVIFPTVSGRSSTSVLRSLGLE